MNVATEAAAGRPVIVVGGGHHARVVIHVLQQLGADIAGYTDPAARGEELAGVVHLGGDDEISRRAPGQVALANGLGNVGMTDRRATVYEELTRQGYDFTGVIHPSAEIVGNLTRGNGCQVMAGAVVQIGGLFGENVIVNTGACIDHGCTLGNHVHVAPGAVLCGEVTVGAHTHVGAGATVIEDVEIGERCVIGAGAVVIRDVPSGSRVVGVPARKM